MLNRQVRQTSPNPGDEDALAPFSDHLTARNLILLGDPGAGKTELFRQAAKASGGEYLSVRRLLTAPIDRLPRDRALWIDALDESRGGRGDRNTVDSVIKQLELLRPYAVRLSCRVADWLGKTDLTAFAPYFDHNGGAPTVVHLQPLDRDEQLLILREHDIDAGIGFLDEARRRGLDMLLANPQTLLMLAQVVRGQQWPATRSALFDRAAMILLEEHNDAHSEREDGPGQYTASELVSSAGALCALRLISDCDGFSLRQNSADASIPSYRDIDLGSNHHVRSALTRRIFISTGHPDVVDYIHRTMAEYLGAKWLADRINTGLPLRRVQSLLGINGQPASALRGLHAWLAILSPRDALTLMDADPMGVVLYADPSQLDIAGKKRLISALSDRADQDPWFYHGGLAAHGIGTLSDDRMADTLRDVLRSTTAPFALKLLVIDTQTHGRPLASLREDLLAVLSDPREPYAIREGCLEALISAGGAALDAICSAYTGFGADEAGLRLRYMAMRTLFGCGLSKADFVDLVRDTVESQGPLPIGATWGVDDAVPAESAPELLNELDLAERVPEHGYPHRQSRDLVRVYERLFVKAISLPLPHEPKQLQAWIATLKRYAQRHGLEGSLKKHLDENPGRAISLLDAWIETPDSSGRNMHHWHAFRRVFAGCFCDSLVIDRLQNAIKTQETDKERLIYSAMLQICFSNPAQYADRFDWLYNYASRSGALTSLRDDCCVCAIEDWRMEDYDHRAKQLNELNQAREEAHTQFDINELQISSGNHLGWIGRIAAHYFAHHDVDDRSADPMSRLVIFFGADRSRIATSGLNALIETRRTVPLTELISLNHQGRYMEWWLGIIAGLDMLPSAESISSGFSDEYLISAIALVSVNPVVRHVGNTIEAWDHVWLQHIIKVRPQLAIQAYASLADASLKAAHRHLDGLQELQDHALAGPDRDSVVADLLLRYPLMHRDALKTLLRMAKVGGIWPSLKAATEKGSVVQEDETVERRDTRHLWLAFGYLNEPDVYQQLIESLQADESDLLVWPLIEMGSLDHRAREELGQYSIAQLKFVATYLAIRYPRSASRMGDIHGNRNPSDASDAIGRILASLAASSEDVAYDALRELAEDPALNSYSDQAKHLLAEQRVRRVDVTHCPPMWRDAAWTLLNRAPSSAEDLHALMIEQLLDVSVHIANANTDPYRLFWNTDSYGHVLTPKTEEIARDALLEVLRPRLQPMGLRAEPEGHMARDNRADILVSNSKFKCVIELKRDYHAQLWSAAADQLERLYARDPEASGYGLYGVFWYGNSRSRSIPAPPHGQQRPSTASDLQEMLKATLPSHLRNKIEIVVLDVSGASLHG